MNDTAILYLTTEGRMIEWRWSDFTPREMLCRGNHECETLIDEHFMDDLQALRDDFGEPLPITSGHRCPTHNHNVGGAQNSGHLVAQATDVAVSGAKAYRLIPMAQKCGFNRIGINLRGDNRFVHLGKNDSEPTMWTY